MSKTTRPHDGKCCDLPVQPLTTKKFNELIASMGKDSKKRGGRPADQHEPQTEAKAKARNKKRRRK